MQVDAFGKIEPSQNVRVLDVNMNNDISAQTYDNFTSNNRKRYGGQRDNQRDHREYRDNRDNRQYYNQGNFQDNKSYQTYSVNDSHSVNTFLSSQVGH
jgi:hypothetical protein